DAIAPARRGDQVDEVACAGSLAEEYPDGTHATRFEVVVRLRAHPAPQTAPFGHAAGQHLLGLAGHRRRAMPLAELDGLLSNRADGESHDQGDSGQDAQEHRGRARWEAKDRLETGSHGEAPPILEPLKS